MNHTNTINTLSKILDDFNKMPYYKNYAAASGNVHNISKHEDAVNDVLKQNGFYEFVPKSEKNKKKRTRSWIEHPELSLEMPVNTFISQPCGTHESPDFIFKISPSVIIAVECKSSTQSSPLYNSGGVTSHYLYVLSSQKYNQSTIYMGSDIINQEQQLIIDKHIKNIRELELAVNQQLREHDTNHRGISFYTRPMINQSGGKTYCDYFTHENRKTAEENVMNYFGKKIMASPASMETTSASMETTSASMETTSASMETTSASMETSAASMETLPPAMETSSASMETLPPAMETSSPALKTAAKEITVPEAEKTAKIAAKTAAKEAEKAVKIAAKEAEKAVKTAAKIAAKEAEKAVKTAAKIAAKEAEKTAKIAAKIAAKEAPSPVAINT
jgi:chemotaxis protein histidine kinase CheA